MKYILALLLSVSCTESKPTIRLGEYNYKNIHNELVSNLKAANYKVSEKLGKRGPSIGVGEVVTKIPTDNGVYEGHEQDIDFNYKTDGTNIDSVGIFLRKNNQNSKGVFNVVFNTLTRDQFDWSKDYQVMYEKKAGESLEIVKFTEMEDVHKNITYIIEGDNINMQIKFNY